jgi:hypothetical protein
METLRSPQAHPERQAYAQELAVYWKRPLTLCLKAIATCSCCGTLKA